MPRLSSSIAVELETLVDDLSASQRLRWQGATNNANYYQESSNGFYDGVAACLDVLADRFQEVSSEDSNSAFFIRNAAHELWDLEGSARFWQGQYQLPQATAVLDLALALEIESRRIAELGCRPRVRGDQGQVS